MLDHTAGQALGARTRVRMRSLPKARAESFRDRSVVKHASNEVAIITKVVDARSSWRQQPEPFRTRCYAIQVPGSMHSALPNG